MGKNVVNVLIVEDYEPIAMLLSRILNRLGCEMEVACSIEAAISRAKGFKVDVLVTDLGLPYKESDPEVKDKFAGIEVAKRVKEMYPKARIIFYSSVPEKDFLERAQVSLGFDYFFIDKLFFRIEEIYKVLD